MNRLAMTLLLHGKASLAAIADDGLAAKYQKNTSIAKDKVALFHDDFEGEKAIGA